MATKKKAPPPPKSSNSELDMVRSLAGILSETGLSEIELEKSGVRFRVSRQMTMFAQQAPMASHSTPVHVPHLAPPAPLASGSAPAVAEKPGLDTTKAVKSPMVGTVYLAPAPGAADFITIGQEIREGQTVLIIEAMKTMNQIPATRAGRVTAILVQNGQPVEYGEPMVIIE